jgi:ferric-dicitrate binding protein FerR (iron transport regulator)
MRQEALRFASRKFLLVLLVFFAVATSFGGEAFAQAPAAGTVTTASGAVQLQRGGATIAVSQGMTVQVGDRIITGGDGHIVVLLSDQSTLELADSSTMVIDQHAGASTRVGLFGGTLRSFVNRTAGAAAPDFQVHTPNAVAAARGTLFNTQFSLPDTTKVSVSDGVVNLANINNLPGGVDIPAGYEATVVGANGPTKPAPVSLTGSFPWFPAIGSAAAAGGLATGIYFAVKGGGPSGTAGSASK